MCEELSTPITWQEWLSLTTDDALVSPDGQRWVFLDRHGGSRAHGRFEKPGGGEVILGHNNSQIVDEKRVPVPELNQTGTHIKRSGW